MRTFVMPREFYIPKGATKVADKQSETVAYLYTSPRGRLGGMVFFGKQAKPAVHYTFRTEAEREACIRRAFEGARARAVRIAGERAKRKAFVATYQVGDIFRTSWGYDQTNVEFFEIVELAGKFAMLRELTQVSEATGDMTGKSVPQSGSYRKGDPIRRLMQDGRIKIDDVRAARPWGKRVAGVVVGEAASWSSYH